MKKILINTMACALVLGAMALSAEPTRAQQDQQSIPEDMQVKKMPRQKLSGPRVGLTGFTGQTADGRDQLGLSPVMSQIGWQFETQLVSAANHSQALMEWILLVGGFESEEYNLSVAWLAGYRTQGGWELGFGPNFSYNPDMEKVTTSLQLAGGATIPVGDFYIPLNAGIGFAKGGPRFTLLTGWIVG